MSTATGKTVLITGADAGLGKDIARRLALRPEIARVHLACRNPEKAIAAKAELEAATGRSIFDIVVMDVADPPSVHPSLTGIYGSIDAVVMNAGGEWAARRLRPLISESKLAADVCVRIP